MPEITEVEKITYDDKDKNGLGDAKLWKTADANEVKTVVNNNADYLTSLEARVAALENAGIAV